MSDRIDTTLVLPSYLSARQVLCHLSPVDHPNKSEEHPRLRPRLDLLAETGQNEHARGEAIATSGIPQNGKTEGAVL